MICSIDYSELCLSEDLLNFWQRSYSLVYIIHINCAHFAYLLLYYQVRFSLGGSFRCFGIKHRSVPFQLFCQNVVVLQVADAVPEDDAIVLLCCVVLLNAFHLHILYRKEPISETNCNSI